MAVNLFQTVGNIEDAHALVRQRVDDLEKVLAFQIRQRGGRLIENEQGGIQRQPLENFHDLPLGDAEIFNDIVGADREAVTVDDCLHLPGALTLVEQTEPAARLATEQNIFGDGQRRDEAQLLEHRADAKIPRVAARADLYALAVVEYLAVVQRIYAGDDFYERGFSRAVFAHQRVDFPLFDGETGVVKNRNAGKALHNIPAFENIFTHGRPPLRRLRAGSFSRSRNGRRTSCRKAWRQG